MLTCIHETGVIRLLEVTFCDTRYLFNTYLLTNEYENRISPEVIKMMNTEFQFCSHGNGKCTLKKVIGYEGERLVVPAYSDEGEKVISIESSALKTDLLKELVLPETFSECSAFFCKNAPNLERLELSPDNPVLKLLTVFCITRQWKQRRMFPLPLLLY